MRRIVFLGSLIVSLLAVGCAEDVPVTAERYASSDALFLQMDANVATAEHLHKVAEIDHSRLGMKASAVMPPARVLIFSDPDLETQLVAVAHTGL